MGRFFDWFIRKQTPKDYKKCEYCGKLSEYPYSLDEWDQRYHMCEECEIAEMADGTLWDV